MQGVTSEGREGETGVMGEARRGGSLFRVRGRAGFRICRVHEVKGWGQVTGVGCDLQGHAPLGRDGRDGRGEAELL